MSKFTWNSVLANGKSVTTPVEVETFQSAARGLGTALLMDMLADLDRPEPRYTDEYADSLVNWFKTDGSAPLVLTTEDGRTDTFTFEA